MPANWPYDAVPGQLARQRSLGRRAFPLRPSRRWPSVSLVETKAMHTGKLYAYRERRGAGQPLRKVKLVDIVGRKGMVKVRFEDEPHLGLEEYVNTRQLMMPWKERK